VIDMTAALEPSPLIASPTAAKEELLRSLSERIRRMEGSRTSRGHDDEPCAVPGWERWLGPSGWPRGGLVEWLVDGQGSGAASLALSACRAAWQSGPLVVIDSRREWYAPGTMACGVDVSRAVFLRPSQPPDVLWSLEQTLRTRGIGAVVCDVEHLSSQACRRLQLAAEIGGGLGLLLRPTRARRQPSFAEFRFLVQPQPSHESSADREARRWRIELLRARGQWVTGSMMVELSDEPDGLRVVSELASATPAA
jgi:protein ImuA